MNSTLQHRRHTRPAALYIFYNLKNSTQQKETNKEGWLKSPHPAAELAAASGRCAYSARTSTQLLCALTYGLTRVRKTRAGGFIKPIASISVSPGTISALFIVIEKWWTRAVQCAASCLYLHLSLVQTIVNKNRFHAEHVET